jgi:DNA excision repair protein ERCC-3
MQNVGKRKKIAVSYAEAGEEYVDSEEEHDLRLKIKRKSSSIGSSRIEQVEQDFTSEDTLVAGSFQDFSNSLRLKPDHDQRPIWVTKDRLIYLEAFSPLYQQACDFLVAVAEPESRPVFIHTYRLTENSLYAAVAVSIATDAIIKVLSRLCKTDLPSDVVTFIRDATYTFGKAKIVLKDNAFFIESKYAEVLRELLRNPIIRNARDTQTIESTETFVQSAAPAEDLRNLDYLKLGFEEVDGDGEDDEEGISDSTGYRSTLQTVSFMIKQASVQAVKRSAKEDSHYPLMEEYDFKNDQRNPLLTIDLRASTKIRPYQEKSLSKVFGNGRARSGIIVLPCGAGKSLTGVTAVSTIKRSTMVMCINNASVKQWKEQFQLWTNVADSSLKLFTSSDKNDLPPSNTACIVISTYSMICHGGRRSVSGEALIQAIAAREWGLMILDEVHVAPAEMFQKVVHMVNAHCKIGLTATLVREDKKIADLNFLVGPKLYEANWIDLTAQGYLAHVQCVEVWCPMTSQFYAEYILNSIGSRSRLQRLLYTLNPCKFRVCEYLVKYHTQRGDKIILFSDDVPALMLYCEALTNIIQVPYIYGGTREDERRTILTAFKLRTECNCIGLSKVGDTALDIPEANVIIQVSSHFGARRQEAQRLGRILRPKPNPTGGYNAFFYTLVSTDTKEMYFSSKRQQYLIDQGYTFKVVQDLAAKADKESSLLRTVTQELDLLNKVLNFKNYDLYDKEEEKELSRRMQGELEDEEGLGSGKATGSGTAVRRKVGGKLSAKSGVGNTVYSEYQAR